MIKSSHILTFSFGAGVTVLIMLGLGYQLDGDMGLCKLEAAGNATETPATCFRSWIGALSGWVAAIAALLVGLPTIKLLKRQLALPVIEAQIVRENQLIDAFVKIEQLAQRELLELTRNDHSDQAEFLTIKNYVSHKMKAECSEFGVADRHMILRELEFSAIAGEIFQRYGTQSSTEIARSFWMMVHNNALEAESHHTALAKHKAGWRDQALVS